MASKTAEVTLELEPETRLAVIDVSKQLVDHHGEALAPYRKHLYCSYHTTAGYLEQSLCARMQHSRESVEALVQSTQKLFPAGASYHHDQMHLRTELTEEQKLVEPHNADSHLAFISLGLENCVTYDNHPDTPVYFIDLDGVNGDMRRQRQTTVVGYNEEAQVAEHELVIPVSKHAIDSVNLKDPRLGIMEQLNELLQHYEIGKGRVILSLDSSEQQAGLTVNEYETLLMKHDLAEVLHNPIRFMAEKGMNMLRDPMAIRNKAKNYVKYDLVQIVNEVIDALGLNESLVERVIDKFAAASASRRLRMKRSVSLLVNNFEAEHGSIVQGTYQSPILVQWEKAEAQNRRINVRLIRFE
ncbi:MAG TPA: hypothetical protein VKP65_21825 [Rhodothermales bacterium]|nr:hypothetical protein [Rhodothermales bacterium]